MKNWIIVILLLLAGAAAYYFISQRTDQPETDAGAVVEEALSPPVSEAPPEPPSTPAEAVRPVTTPDATQPPAVEEIPLPMLADSDPVVLDTIGGWIGEPAVARYLVSDNVVSRIVATVDTMGSARIPGVVSVVQGPADEFRVTANTAPETIIRNEEGDELPQFLINPANYERYSAFVDMLESVDTASLVTAYRQHYPLFQEAYRQMGYADGDFNSRLIQVIDELLLTPQVPDPVNLVKPEAFYLFTDPDLEALTAGQKILLRMGSSNAARVKARLMEIRSAL